MTTFKAINSIHELQNYIRCKFFYIGLNSTSLIDLLKTLEKRNETFVKIGSLIEQSSIFFQPCYEAKLYRMLVIEFSDLLHSIDSPSISNPRENRSKSLTLLAYIVVGLSICTHLPDYVFSSLELALLKKLTKFRIFPNILYAYFSS